MKWLGALLLIGAGAAVGLSKITTLKKQIKLMDELCVFVRYLQIELYQRARPLPVLLRTYERDCWLPIEGLCKAAEQGRALTGVVSQSLSLCGNTTAQVMTELFDILGKYDSETQAQACGRALLFLEKEKQNEEKQLKEKASLYRTVPLTLGIMAALILL